MTVIAARATIVDGELVGPTEIVVDQGIIAEVRPIADRAGILDGVLAPGFVDLQVNGVDDVDVASADGDDWSRLDELLLAQGTTTWLPTLITAPLDGYAAPLARIASAMARPVRWQPTIAGVHLEGPFLGGAPGAHPTALIVPLDLDWLAALPGHVRLITLAPEQPLAPVATRRLREQGIVVSLGHSRADQAATVAATDAGATMVTHLFNGMGPLHHREPGIAAVGLTDPRLTVGLIADGVHVHERMIRLAFAACGASRIALVTDAVAWRAGSAGAVRVSVGDDGAPRLPSGTLAGSALTMNAAIRFVVNRCGVSLPDAITAASTTPATLLGLGLGLTDRGRVSPGQRGDLVLLDEDLLVTATWTAGQLAYRREGL